MSATPHRCPVCNGTGIVPNGFYSQIQYNTATPEKCRSCENGIVWDSNGLSLYEGYLQKENKHHRQEITRRKYLNRCKAMNLDPDTSYKFKEQGKPCSCPVCSQSKFNRKVKHRNHE